MPVLWRVPHVSRLESFWCPVKVGWFAFRVSILPRRTKSKFKTIMVKKISKRFTHIFTHTHNERIRDGSKDRIIYFFGEIPSRIRIRTLLKINSTECPEHHKPFGHSLLSTI